MISIRWVGAAPRPEQKAALGKAGFAAAATGTITVSRVLTPQPRPWLWLSDDASDEQARAAVALGAYDVVTTGQLVKRLHELLVPFAPVTPPRGFIAKSAAARRLLEHVAQAARTSMPVLLTGETGTGKELAARLIHQSSARAKRTFVPINCAAIPDELMEGELFGYVKGAFSGAVRDYDGQLQAAAGGTVFLDEIDDTPHALQVKLLRVTEDRVISRLGENEWHQVDFRILAASNRDLRRLIDEGTFGADLYERLATVAIELPPLRERLEDLPELVDELLARFYREEPSREVARVKGCSPRALAAMAAYAWPGNIRELRNVIFGALVAKRAGDELLLSDLPRRLLSREAPAAAHEVVDADAVRSRIASGRFNLRTARETLERVALKAALQTARGNAAEAARLLGEVGRGSARQPGGTVRVMAKRLGL
ncbi:MAG: sigma 54-interacting transcriptional regulator [Archangiaceae bacterium]|nr:sigma 54-interacting transcriptional regulator [Archangiaceae bacterium]